MKLIILYLTLRLQLLLLNEVISNTVDLNWVAVRIHKRLAALCIRRTFHMHCPCIPTCFPLSMRSALCNLFPVRSPSYFLMRLPIRFRAFPLCSAGDVFPFTFRYTQPCSLHDKFPEGFLSVSWRIRCGLPQVLSRPLHHAFSVRSLLLVRVRSPIRSLCIHLAFSCVSSKFAFSRALRYTWPSPFFHGIPVSPFLHVPCTCSEFPHAFPPPLHCAFPMRFPMLFLVGFTTPLRSQFLWVALYATLYCR